MCRYLATLFFLCGCLSAAQGANAASTFASTDWDLLASITVSTPTGGVPYLETSELGAPPSTESFYNDVFGSALASWEDTATGTTWLVVGAYGQNDIGAAYVFSRASEQAPWHQEARLLASDAAEGDAFGEAVAIEGSTIVVSAPGHGSGAIYTFDRETSGAWIQKDEIASAFLSFGTGLALSEGILAVSAPYLDSGHVFVYKRSMAGPGWSLLGSLSPSDLPPNGFFGASLSIDNGRVLVGAPGDSTIAPHRGSAYLFVFDPATSSWAFNRKLAAFPDGGAEDYFGQSVLLRGNEAFIGVPGRNSNSGAVDTFVRDTTGSWAEQVPLQAMDSKPGDQFGSSSAMVGSSLAIGAPGRSASAGAICIFGRSAGNWMFQSTVTAPNSQSTGFSLAAAGDDFVAGSPGVRIDRSGRGRVDVFSNDNDGWAFSKSIVASADDTESFGYSVALSSDAALITAPNRANSAGLYGATEFYGRSAPGIWNWQQEVPYLGSYAGQILTIQGDTAVVGAPDQNFGANTSQGAAYVLTRARTASGDLWIQQATLADVGGGTHDQMGSAVAIDGDTIAVGASRYGRAGIVYIYTYTASTWTLQAKFSPIESETSDGFGSAVALHGDVLLVGAPSANTNAGAAYIFQRVGAKWTEKKRIVAPDRAVSDRFGSRVALSSRDAIISAPPKNIGAKGYAGRVYLFNTNDWTNTSMIDSPAPDDNNNFGAAVAMTGSRLAVGEPGSASAYLYTRSAAGWSLQSAITGSANSRFGTDVALSESSVLIGAPYDGTGLGHAAGRAYLFQDDRIFADGFQ